MIKQFSVIELRCINNALMVAVSAFEADSRACAELGDFRTAERFTRQVTECYALSESIEKALQC